jgi:hypothetical protein
MFAKAKKVEEGEAEGIVRYRTTGLAWFKHKLYALWQHIKKAFCPAYRTAISSISNPLLIDCDEE